jgi:hypothetical protein
MPLRLGRVLVAAVIAEAIPIILLVVLVALFGPRERAAAQAYAERLGQWVGPIGGTLMCFLTARWTVRALRARQVLYGSAVGLLAAFIDVAILIASGATFQWLFVASNFGRLLAGTLGAFTASRRSQTSSERC